MSVTPAFRSAPWLILAAMVAMSPCRAAEPGESGDLYFGEALYYARMGEYFKALERLDTELRQHYALDEPVLDSLYPYMDDAEFSVGDFELRYRMHLRAGRAIRAVLESDVDEVVRNDAAYRLARIHFQKGQLPEALQALERIDGEVPESIADDIEFLRANTDIALGRPAEATDVLRHLQDSKELRLFVAYNLGIALLQQNQKPKALLQLEKAGRAKASEPADLAIRDKANLVLGTILLESGDYARAGDAFDRVRLAGPFSNQALLSAGWAAVSDTNYERAIVPWSRLAEREVTDAAVQEAMLALPYAFAKLNVHGRAAERYGRALDTFGAELHRLDASIKSIREGRFLEALIREEIRHDKNWVIRLRSLPETPETYYLMQLMASHDFQTGLQNYLDLADLRSKLKSWQRNFDAFEEMVSLRRTHYEPLLPEIDTRFRALDSRMRLRIEQHKLLRDRLQSMLTAPRPELLATREEQLMMRTIETLRQRLANEDTGAQQAPGHEESLQRLRRLEGRLTWKIHTEYAERLTVFDEHLRDLTAAMEVLEAQYRRFVRVRQAASHSFQGYDKPLVRMRTRTTESLAKLDMLMARQGRLLELAAVDELMARRQRLENYQQDARYALADSYDRATQLQARKERE